MTKFDEWLVNFLDKAEIDINEKCTAGDGSEIDFAAVITQIVKASEWEKNKIRKQMFQCKAKGIPIKDLLKAYAGHLSALHKVTP